MQRRAQLLAWTLTAVIGLWADTSAAKKADSADPNQTCLMCHSDMTAKGTAGKQIGVDATAFAGSVHGQMQFKCTDCHTDAALGQVPHPPTLKPADCGSCHEAAVKDYQATAHGRARGAGSTVAATCSDCHGNHGILKADNPSSRVHHANVEQTCGSCHGSDKLVVEAKVPGGNIVAMYHDSIHGQKAAQQGPDSAKAPSCVGCHGAHNLLGKSEADSKVHRENIAQMCGSCHMQVFSRVSASQHGQLRQAGNSAAPTCIDCHSAHQIRAHATTGFQLDVIKECGSCHQDFIQTYRDTYHGKVTQLGYTRVATCASCHGAHEVLPASNPRSMISPENRVNTCRACHAGANANFVMFKPHGNAHDRHGDPILYYTRTAMVLLLAGVFTFFGLHTLLWLYRELRVRRETNRKEKK